MFLLVRAEAGPPLGETREPNTSLSAIGIFGDQYEALRKGAKYVEGEWIFDAYNLEIERLTELNAPVGNPDLILPVLEGVSILPEGFCLFGTGKIGPGKQKMKISLALNYYVCYVTEENREVFDLAVGYLKKQNTMLYYLGFSSLPPRLAN